MRLGLEPSRNYSGSEMERMMKLQDVLLKAMAKKITWWQVAEIIGVTAGRCAGGENDWRNTATAGWRTGGRASRFRRVPLKTCEEVLRLYREKYFDLSIRHFHEKLREGTASN